jgi:hypothetical protein
MCTKGITIFKGFLWGEWKNVGNYTLIARFWLFGKHNMMPCSQGINRWPNHLKGNGFISHIPNLKHWD